MSPKKQAREVWVIDGFDIVETVKSFVASELDRLRNDFPLKKPYDIYQIAVLSRSGKFSTNPRRAVLGDIPFTSPKIWKKVVEYVNSHPEYGIVGIAFPDKEPYMFTFSKENN